MYALALVSAAFVAGQAAASTVIPRNALAGLLNRQTTAFDPSDIPAQCQSDCSAVVSALNSCSTVSCLCSETTNTGLYKCLECALGLDPDAALLAQGQDSLNEYQSSCQQAGVSITPLTLTLPSGATATGASGSSATDRASVTFDSIIPTGITSGSGSKATGGSGSTETTAGGASDPLATDGAATRNNGAGFLAVSSTAVVGAVGVAMVVLSL
ncbi:hypothetical protein OH76DRAFT_1407460 [Lentinus brumalis]|uniref:Extracellular membrane protein CFEM domain-containing protein n=1 Tax=Lentinus brumalis TaxID=2498619 RepID=A0A371D028_9APHY|nr:hypothetical protein OH76DRAFT_1407460 [Polyporus brumalis]